MYDSHTHAHTPTRTHTQKHAQIHLFEKTAIQGTERGRLLTRASTMRRTRVRKVICARFARMKEGIYMVCCRVSWYDAEYCNVLQCVAL